MKKYTALTSLLLCINAAVSACPVCNQQIRNAIYNSTFYPNLFTMLSAFIVLGIIVVVLSFLGTKNHNKRLALHSGLTILSPVPLSTAAMVGGIGLGGFVDGIVLHQILQVHEMLSAKVAATNYIGKSVNMFWDGIFHLFCFLVVLLSLFLLWKLLGRNDINRSGKLFGGGLLAGWGLFNLVEGMIDHQWLGLHNVIEFSANHNVGNYSFLGISTVMLATGYALIRNEERKAYSTNETTDKNKKK